MSSGSEPDDELQAQQLKAIAEAKFKKSKLKSALKYAKRAHRLCPSIDGLSHIITSFRILQIAAKSPAGSTPNWYEILQVDPFSHINTIRSQYKKLALVLHPDKNFFLGSGDAFKLVCDAFEVLSDRVKRKEYDRELKFRLLAESTGELTAAETFWTACSRCSLLHQFERRYVGHILMCPSCKRKFLAVEAESDGGESGVRVSSGSEGSSVEKLGNAGTDSGDDDSDGDKLISSLGLKGKIGSGVLGWNKLRIARSTMDVDDHNSNGESENSGREAGGSEWKGGRLRRRTRNVEALLKRSVVKKAKVDDEMMTLAEMQLEVKRTAQKEKEKLKIKEKENRERTGPSKNNRNSSIKTSEALRECSNLGNDVPAAPRKRVDKEPERSRDVDGMTVEDSDFYDFDKDRVEKSFKQGQIWAVYDDDGMPRLYVLIDEVISMYPFEVKMSWLDLRNNGDNDFICRENMGFHISCGVFRVSRKTNMDSLNIFSHIMPCERAAKGVYRIYPAKGSVWALYNDENLDGEERNVSGGEKRCYDIGVFLTSYSENYGLSMAYLEKVDGFKTVFRRQEIGCHAIRWFERDDIRLFSHQIPARKLCGEEVADNLKECWELDPASLPSDMLSH